LDAKYQFFIIYLCLVNNHEHHDCQKSFKVKNLVKFKALKRD